MLLGKKRNNILLASYHAKEMDLTLRFSRSSLLKGCNVFVMPKFSPVEAKMEDNRVTVSGQRNAFSFILWLFHTFKA